MACITPVARDSHRTQGQVNIIVDNKQLLYCQRKSLQQARHGNAAIVHVGQGLGNAYGFILEREGPHERLTCNDIHTDSLLKDKRIHDMKPYVMPGP
jgi:hypothetical protein